jgi:hypothetical protein
MVLAECRCVIVPHLSCVLRFHYQRGTVERLECDALEIRLLPLFCCATHSNFAVDETNVAPTRAIPVLNLDRLNTHLGVNLLHRMECPGCRT